MGGDGKIVPQRWPTTSASLRMSDADLLQIEMETLWGEDAYGRFKQRPHVVILAASTHGGIYVSEGFSQDLTRRLRELTRCESMTRAPSQPPPSLERWRELLGSLGAVEQTSGPSYLIAGGTQYPCSATILRSDQHPHDPLRDLRPSRWWESDEWDDLLQGRLGPWAIMLEDRKIISICHTPRASGRGAEAGVWTHPDYRGRGHAAAVTAAWASTPIREGRMLFYSTSADNESSRRVAERLALRPIGWIWTLRLKSEI